MSSTRSLLSINVNFAISVYNYKRKWSPLQYGHLEKDIVARLLAGICYSVNVVDVLRSPSSFHGTIWTGLLVWMLEFVSLHALM